MPGSKRILILGGTGEAAELARALAGRPGIEVISSLAGRTRAPATPAGSLRVGGFGGPQGLMDYLGAERIAAIVDATHPFATRIGRNAALAAASLDVPLLRLERPAWEPVRGDRWIEVDSLAGAAEETARHGARVFLTVGRTELKPFAHLGDIWFLVRLIEEPPAPLPLPRHGVVVGRGPFAEADEAALIRRHRIDLLVSKNSGGAATYAKIAAARRLGIPAVLVRRPPTPPNPPPAVATVAEAVAWIEAQPRGR